MMRARTMTLCFVLTACAGEGDGERKQELGGLDASVDGGLDASPRPVENVCAAHGGSCMLVNEQSFCGGGYELASYACAANQSADVACCVPGAAVDAAVDASVADAGPSWIVCTNPTDAGQYSNYYQGKRGRCLLSPKDADAGTSGVVRNDAGQLVLDQSWWSVECQPGGTCMMRAPDRAGYQSCFPRGEHAPGQCWRVNCGTIDCGWGWTCVDPEQSICR